MSVLAFEDVQSTAKALIAAHPFFVGQTVIENRGQTLGEIEAALRDLGQAVIVYPIKSDTDAANGLGSVKTVVFFDVLFIFNPEKGTLDIYEMVVNGVSAVIDYFPPNNPNDRFKFDSIQIAEDDSGVWGYIVTFKKAVQIT